MHSRAKCPSSPHLKHELGDPILLASPRTFEHAYEDEVTLEVKQNSSLTEISEAKYKIPAGIQKLRLLVSFLSNKLIFRDKTYQQVRDVIRGKTENFRDLNFFWKNTK